MTVDNRRGKKPPSTVPLSSVLPQVTRDLALDQKVREFALLALWEKEVPETYRKRTRAMRLFQRGDRTVLMVRVKDAATAGELSFSVPQIRERLNRYSPQTGFAIDAIELKIGSI